MSLALYNSKGSDGVRHYMARKARSLALYGSKGSELSIVWARKARNLALYGLKRLGGIVL